MGSRGLLAIGHVVLDLDAAAFVTVQAPKSLFVPNRSIF